MKERRIDRGDGKMRKKA